MSNNTSSSSYLQNNSDYQPKRFYNVVGGSKANNKPM